MVPDPALLSNGENFFAFAIDAQNDAVVKPVKLRLRLAGKAETLSGINAGDRIVV